mmetsp:Transcript_49574/g.116887  ORF Transcript_49574/g.116887 Transcript_49574/m.116887 type:complete len:341 (-) Transcript_49574:1356-2378(-)
MRRAPSPQVASLLRVHGTADRTLERLRKLRELAERPDHSELGGRMLVCEEGSAGADALLLVAPGLAHGDEEELAVLGARAVLGDKRLPRELEPAAVGDRLAERQLPVDVAPEELVGREEVRDACRALLELAHHLRRPPALAVPVRVVLAPDVVEPVRHLMPTDRADAPVVARHRLRLRVERRLQDPGGDEDAVDLARVVRVDVGGRGRAPAPAVDGLPEARERVGHVERVGGDDVVEVALVLDPAELLERLEGALRPRRRVPDLEEHVLQLVHRRRARRRVHPVLGLQRLVELIADLVEHFERRAPRRLRERRVDKQLRDHHVHRLPGREEALAPPRREV